jgi:hypothetical protein
MRPQVSITANDLLRARETFEKNESRDLFYRVASELVDLTLRSERKISLAEALAVLLQTWNREYYRFRRFDAEHFDKLETLVKDTLTSTLTFRARSISSLSDSDRNLILNLFSEFENVLHPVGAVKALHLLAPSFFPLWDRAIASAYGCSMGLLGTNAPRYLRFMTRVKEQASQLQQTTGAVNLLKAIDEYNYCKFSKHWF